MVACFTANDTEDMAFAASVITPVRNIGIKDSAFAAAGMAMPMRWMSRISVIL